MANYHGRLLLLSLVCLFDRPMRVCHWRTDIELVFSPRPVRLGGHEDCLAARSPLHSNRLVATRAHLLFNVCGPARVRLRARCNGCPRTNTQECYRPGSSPSGRHLRLEVPSKGV